MHKDNNKVDTRHEAHYIIIIIMQLVPLTNFYNIGAKFEVMSSVPWWV